MSYLGNNNRTSTVQKIDAITFNGTNKTFNLYCSGVAVSPGSTTSLVVSVNNVVLNPLVDYVVVGSTITFTTAYTGGTSFWAVSLGISINQSTVTPSAGSVGSSALNQQAIGSEYALITSVVGTNAITGIVSGIASYSIGQTFKFVSVGANTGASTININSIGAVALTKSGSTALSGGDIPSGATVMIMFDGTRFQLMGVSGGASAGGIFYENNTTLTSNYTITAGKNASMVGPLTVATGVSLTVPTGARLVVL